MTIDPADRRPASAAALAPRTAAGPGRGPEAEGNEEPQEACGRSGDRTRR